MSGLDLDAMCDAAMGRITAHINRSAGQHLRAMNRKPAAAVVSIPMQTRYVRQGDAKAGACPHFFQCNYPEGECAGLCNLKGDKS